MNFTAAQAACLRVHRKMDSETEGTKAAKVFPKEAEFPEPDNLTEFHRVNAARTRLEIER